MVTLRFSVVSALLSGLLFSVACGDDDGGGGTPAAGGKAGSGGRAQGGASSGGTAGTVMGGRAAGGTAGATTGGSPGQGGTANGGASGGTPSGGTAGNPEPPPDGAGAGGITGEAGAAGASGGVAGAAEAGSGGVAGGEDGSGGAGEAGSVGAAGSGGTAGEASLSPVHLYVGCADSQGTLQSYVVDGATISPGATILTGGAVSNSLLNADEDRLYVAHTVSGGETQITTYTRNVTTGALTSLGTPAGVPSESPGDGGAGGGAGASSVAPLPQTLTLDAGEDYLAVPNYAAGNVYVYEVLGNGTVGEIVSSDDGGSNAHHAVFSNNNNYVLVPYLGSNRISVYAFDDDTGDITVDSEVDMPAAEAGPRHLALHPNGSWLYSINETAGGAASDAGSIDLFTFNQSNGDLTPEETFSIPVPDGYSGLKNGSEIEIAPSGNFLYVSMRLDNVAMGSIVVYAIESDGELSFVEQESSRGVTPRHFSLSSNGRLLVAGNQNSDTIALFEVDTGSGELTFLDDRDVCDSPRFARFADIR
jgi:6-phosphogluconolactonase (cycloisomerase 2 family)